MEKYLIQSRCKVLLKEGIYKKIYSELTVYFQPIFLSETNKIFGYEALTRHISKNINIQKLFDDAKKDGSIYILDMLCRRNALKEASKQRLKNYLFINVCPETLLNPQHTIGITDQFAEEFNFPKEKIILEITEQSAIENYEIFIKSLFYYKDRGYGLHLNARKSVLEVMEKPSLLIGYNITLEEASLLVQSRQIENLYDDITKNLLSILEGDMSIKSEYNKGTEVEIFIPSKKQ